MPKNFVVVTSGNGLIQWLKANKHGCTSWLTGISNIDPKIEIEFYKSYKKNNLGLCNLIIKNIAIPFAKIQKKYGWHLTVKAFIECNGIFRRFERMPLEPIDKKNMKKIEIDFKKIKQNSDKNFEKMNFFNFK